MRSRNRIIGIGATVILLLVLTVLQLQAQTPTATPENPAVTTSAAPETTTVARQAVVKTPIDGDSVEVIFVDDGQVATVHLANIKAPGSVGETECFGRESAQYAAQSLQEYPLISIELTREIEDDEVEGYITLSDGALLNEILVLFGYARYDREETGIHAESIRTAEQQSQKGNVGLWRVCGDGEEASNPCFLFAGNHVDSASQRDFFAEYPEAEQLNASFTNALYDPAQNEIIVMWDLAIDGMYSSWRMREFYRLSDCVRDRSEVFDQSDNR